MLSVDYTNEGWNKQQNISFYLFMKIKRAVFTAGEGLFFFFSPSLCHLILFPLWKQQIYAWSWTGKNWTLLPAGILPWRAAGSDERFHPEQIREYSTMSLFAQGTLLGRQEQGLSWCAPTSLGQPVRWGGAWGKTVRFLPASSVPNVTKWDIRGIFSLNPEERISLPCNCYVSWCSEAGLTPVWIPKFSNKSPPDVALQCTILSSLPC